MQDPSDGQLLFSEETIRRRVAELAKEVSAHYGDRPLSCIVVLRGAVFFAIDLVRQVEGPERIEIDFVRLESYAGKSARSSVRIKSSMPRVAGRDVLVIEDMMDSGRTMEMLQKALELAGASSVRYAVLIFREGQGPGRVDPEHVAFHYDGDQYLYGYGLDIDGNYRTLTHIGGVPRDSNTIE